MVIWRVHPYLSARRAVAEVYRTLSAAANDLRGLLLAGGTDEAAWTAHAQAHWRAARAAIEAARETVMDTLRAQGGPSDRARQGLIRLESSDQLFGALIAFSDALEHAAAHQRAVAERLLRRLRPLLLVLAESIVTDSAKANRQIGRSIAAMAADAAALPKADTVRAASAAAPALAVTMLWFTPYDHWLTITIVMTMQPYFGLTYTRALERIGGMAGLARLDRAIDCRSCGARRAAGSTAAVCHRGGGTHRSPD